MGQSFLAFGEGFAADFVPFCEESAGVDSLAFYECGQAGGGVGEEEIVEDLFCVV